MKKFLNILLIITIIALLITGCAKRVKVTEEKREEVIPEKTTMPPPEETPNDTVDAVTTASIVNSGAALSAALSENGTWIAATLKDITLTEDLVVEGEFFNKGVIARKIALYTQDEDHNIVDSFNLTAPKLIVRSENSKLQGGTFIGDVYVEANGFTLSMATIEGNLYYMSQGNMDTSIMDDGGVITGTTEVLE